MNDHTPPTKKLTLAKQTIRSLRVRTKIKTGLSLYCDGGSARVTTACDTAACGGGAASASGDSDGGGATGSPTSGSCHG